MTPHLDDHLLPLPVRAPWQADAACRGVDPDLFFPGRGESTREAKEVCAGCPVRQQCLDDALANGEKVGIFGGTSERERRVLRRQLPVTLTCRHCHVEFTVPPREGRDGSYPVFCGDDCRRARANARQAAYHQRRTVA